MQYSDVDTALLLAGGKGSRLGALTINTPKPLLEVDGRPFIAWQIDYLRGEGIKNIIISTCYLADQFETAGRYIKPVVKLLQEPTPLGTGGAIVYALNYLPKRFLVLNADTFCPIPLCSFFNNINEDWLGGIAAVWSQNARRFGVVQFGKDRLLKRFKEKTEKVGYINSGVYVFDKSFFAGFDVNTFQSLESDLISRRTVDANLGVVTFDDVAFLDIGIKEDYENASAVIQDYDFGG